MFKTVVLKYGGNAMTNAALKAHLIQNITLLKDRGYKVIVVFGGGPFIRETLDIAEIESEFIDGQRKTSPRAMEYVEMALKGKVNGDLVRLINLTGHNAVGLSGKDGQLVIARKRAHLRQVNGRTEAVDLGRVGDVVKVNTGILDLLLANDYIPVIACLAADEEGRDLNINGDIFAGSIAGAVHADEFIVLTDVDGLLRDINDPESLIRNITLGELPGMVEDGTITGGMIPKMDACRTALENGAGRALIINGTKPDQLLELLGEEEIGTSIIN